MVPQEKLKEADMDEQEKRALWAVAERAETTINALLAVGDDGAAVAGRYLAAGCLGPGGRGGCGRELGHGGDHWRAVGAGAVSFPKGRW